MPAKSLMRRTAMHLVIPTKRTTTIVSKSTIQYYQKKKRDLSHIQIHDGVTRIEESAFRNCSGLKFIIIPGSVKVIDDYAFSGCTNLETVIFNTGLETIGRGAFSGCIKLQKIIIPESVKEIKYGAFFCCNSLAEFHFPKEMEIIGEYAFSGCNGLTTIKVLCKGNEEEAAQINLNSIKIEENNQNHDNDEIARLIGSLFMSEDRTAIQKGNKIIDILAKWMTTPYDWNGKDEFYTILCFHRYSIWLNHGVETNDALSQISCITSVLGWGGVDQNITHRIPDFYKGLQTVSREQINDYDSILKQGIAQINNNTDTIRNDDYRISSWSKILAAYQPGKLFIYDSRVALALSYISSIVKLPRFWAIPDSRIGKSDTKESKAKKQAMNIFKSECQENRRRYPDLACLNHDPHKWESDGADITKCYKWYLNLLKLLSEHDSIIQAYRQRDNVIQNAYQAIGFTEKQAIMAHLEKMLFMQKESILVPNM